MRACQICNTLNDDAHRFCVSCGSAFTGPVAVTVPTAPVQERFGFEKSEIITGNGAWSPTSVIGLKTVFYP